MCWEVTILSLFLHRQPYSSVTTLPELVMEPHQAFYCHPCLYATRGLPLTIFHLRGATDAVKMEGTSSSVGGTHGLQAKRSLPQPKVIAHPHIIHVQANL